MLKLKSLDLARVMRDSGVEPHVIVIGPDRLYWVMPLKDAQRMLEMGYERVE